MISLVIIYLLSEIPRCRDLCGKEDTTSLQFAHMSCLALEEINQPTNQPTK